GATGDLFLQLAGSAGALLRYNAELHAEPTRIDPPERGPIGAFGCLGDGSLIASLHGTLYRLALRNDEPHQPLPIDLTGLDPRWILPHPQTDRFWMVDTAGNARLVGLPRPTATTPPARAQRTRSP
ncbi:MAG TPA: hypothetical protein VL860_13210, partial [Planctomycetota bacterium]|nr:hypothetical protein [Planctomycetota bacterium]